MTDNFDVIVIGSGIGGLNCGAQLAHQGMKVLVLEQHSKIGGYTHNFKRKNFTFESGVHSVPMSQDGTIMHILRQAGADKLIEPIELKSMYSIESPSGKFTMPSRYDDITELFREHGCTQSEITTFKDSIDFFYDQVCGPLMTTTSNDYQENKEFMSRFHNLSYSHYIEKISSSKSLLNILEGQWPYAGLSPEQCSSIFASGTFFLHVKEGSHFCKGGFASLANALAQVIVSSGGAVKTKACVKELRVENNRVTHVITSDGNEYKSSITVSNISPYDLHKILLPEHSRSKLYARRLSNLKPSVSCVIIYIGLKPTANSILPDSIHFLYDTFDFESIYQNIQLNNKEHLDHLLLLPGINEGSNPTLTLMNFVRHDYSTDWHSDKMKIAEKMIDKLEFHYPGIRDSIELIEVGSPDTFYRYTRNTSGSIYGFENIKDVYGEAKLPITTHLPNLFQTGHWGKPGCGIWNVMFNSYGASKTILKSI